MIEQVLINLLKNAIEALSETENPTLELIGRYDENSVKIEIIDNGSGIIKEALEHIFVPFYTTKRTGSGIGLSFHGKSCKCTTVRSPSNQNRM